MSQKATIKRTALYALIPHYIGNPWGTNPRITTGHKCLRGPVWVGCFELTIYSRRRIENHIVSRVRVFLPGSICLFLIYRGRLDVGDDVVRNGGLYYFGYAWKWRLRVGSIATVV
jgi:hypothetical protein